MIKKTLAASLNVLCTAAIMLSSFSPALAVTPEVPLSDVKETYIYYPAIQYVYNQGIMTGTSKGEFLPNGKLTRGQLSKIIIEAKFSDDEINNCTTNYFPDVAENNNFRKYICVAKEKGIIDGFSDGTFKDGNEVSFAEAAKIIVETYNPGFVATPDPYFGNFWSYLQKLESQKALPFESYNAGHVNETARRWQIAEVIYRLDNNITDRNSSRLTDIAYYNLDVEILPKAEEVQNRFDIFADFKTIGGLDVDDPQNIEKVYKLGKINSGKILAYDRFTQNQETQIVDANDFEIFYIVYKELGKSVCGVGQNINYIIIQNPVTLEIYTPYTNSFLSERYNANVLSIKENYENILNILGNPAFEYIYINENASLASDRGFLYSVGYVENKFKNIFLLEDATKLIQVDSIAGEPIYSIGQGKYARYYLILPGGFIMPMALILDYHNETNPLHDNRSIEGEYNFGSSAQIRRIYFGEEDLKSWGEDDVANYLIFDKSAFGLREIGALDGKKLYERVLSEDQYRKMYDGYDSETKMSYDEFKKSHPIVYMETPDNKVIEIANQKLLRAVSNNC